MSSAVAEANSLEQEAERIVREVGIPPCPGILTAVVREMRRDEPDMRKLSELLGSDVALSATLLKTVNSPFYGLSTKAGTVQQALSILGLRAGVNLVTGLLLRQAFPVTSSALMEDFWERSMRLAAASAALAPRLKCCNRDQAHTFALFRDCGLAVMIRKFPMYEDIVDYSAADPGQPITEVEGIRYDVNHARVGYTLARSWFLPETIGRAILHHHDLAQVSSGKIALPLESARLVALGLLAEHLCTLRAIRPPCPDWPMGEELVFDAFGLDETDVAALAVELEGDLG
jgi:HD-like signal output (HDOD) protein